jgi:DNA mismatch endonuclease (patch repair protein)
MTRYDPLTKAERSERMSRIRNADTEPEMIVRRLVHGMGYRFRLHARDLPGNPDLVFRPRKKVIFVHGCFWHQHGCRQYRQPRTKRAFWEPKLARNKLRDAEVRKMLQMQGWKTMTVWECQLRRTGQLATRLTRLLEKDA